MNFTEDKTLNMCPENLKKKKEIEGKYSKIFWKSNRVSNRKKFFNKIFSKHYSLLEIEFLNNNENFFFLNVWQLNNFFPLRTEKNISSLILNWSISHSSYKFLTVYN